MLVHVHTCMTVCIWTTTAASYLYLSCTHTGSPTFLPCSLFWQESNVLLVGRGHIVKVSKRCIHSKLMILTSTNILIWRLIEMWEWGHFRAKQLALTISISGPEEPYIVHYLIISLLVHVCFNFVVCTTIWCKHFSWACIALFYYSMWSWCTKHWNSNSLVSLRLEWPCCSDQCTI